MDGYSYVLELVDQLSGPARSIKQQVDLLSTSLAADQREMKALQDTMMALRSTGTLTAETERQLTAAMKSKQAAMDQGATSIRSLVSKEQAHAKAEKDQADAMKASSAEASGLGETLASLGPYVMAAVAALAVLGGILAAGIIGGGKLALDAVQFKAQTTAALKSVLGTGEAASATFVEIRKISDEIGISEKRAQSLGLSLLDAGVAQKDLGDTIKSIAMLEKVRGAEAAGKLENLIKKAGASGKFELSAKGLVGTGISEKDVIGELAKQMHKSTAQVDAELKAGKITAADGIKAINAALNAQSGGANLVSFQDAVGKISEAFTRLFEDVNVSPLIDALKEVAGWFATGTSAGDALHWLITTIFDGIFAAAKEVLPYVKIAFLELVIVALQIYIAFKPIIAQMREIWTSIAGAKGGTDNFGEAIKILIDGLGYYIGEFIFWMGMVLSLIQIVITVWDAMSDAAGAAWDAIVGVVESIYNTIASLFDPATAQDTAMSLITGLVSGILGGGPAVVDALIGVGKSAIAGVKGILGIASPSKVMAEMGGYAAEGFAQGAEDGQEGAQGSLEKVAAPPGGGAGGGGRGVTITIEAGAVVIQGAGANATELLEAFETRLQDLFETLAMQIAAGPAEG